MLYDLVRMSRGADPNTSRLAAQTAIVRRTTLRARVLQLALEFGVRGIADQDIRDAYPKTLTGESLRKRRSELAQENWLIDTGLTRINANGQQERVFIHREFCRLPPPLVEREATHSPKAIIAEQQAEIDRLKALLTAHQIAH